MSGIKGRRPPGEPVQATPADTAAAKMPASDPAADAAQDQALRAVLAEDGQVIATSSPAAQTSTPTLAPGDVVPDLVITTTDGKTVSLGGSDKPTALMFFAPWCESYLAESRPSTATACRRVREAVEPLAARGDASGRLSGSSGPSIRTTRRRHPAEVRAVLREDSADDRYAIRNATTRPEKCNKRLEDRR